MPALTTSNHYAVDPRCYSRKDVDQVNPKFPLSTRGTNSVQAEHEGGEDVD